MQVPSLVSRPREDEASVLPTAKETSFRHRLIIFRREFHAASQLATLCTLFFVIIFVLGAQSSIQGSNGGLFALSDVSRAQDVPPAEPPVQLQLHEQHSVPKKYLRLMSIKQQHALLTLLAKPISKTSVSSISRRAVFVLISRCSLYSCFRALASAMTYATSTGRVAVVFAKEVDGIRLTEIIRLKSDGVLNDDALILSLNEEFENFHDARISLDMDWAELSVAHAFAPSSYSLNITASNSFNGNELPMADPKIIQDGANSLEGHLPTIGNTKVPATLDNLAAVNSHVSVSLNEVFWSSYSPRSVQEGLFETELFPALGVTEKFLARSSLLGRRQETRSVAVTEDRLHALFSIPRMLLKGMTTLGKKLLLLKLESKKRRGNPSPRAIFVHTQYGLGNRLRALGSAMAFARKTDRVLVLIWVPDQHLNCRYTDLFVGNDEFVVSDSFDAGEEWPFRNNSASDEAMQRVKWYNYMRVNGTQVNSPADPITDDTGYHVYVSTCYVIQSPVTPFIIRTTSSFWHVLRSLSPQIEVLRLVERFSSYPLSEMIGIHIRGKSIKTDISGVTATNYTAESSRTTDFWRNLTQVDTFIAEMRRQPVDQLFYVAADSKDVFSRLEREFPSRVFYTPRTCDSRDRECLPFALADILLLAKCSSLRGSYWSSFSELSTRIGGARFLLAGIDFGRPDRQLFR